MELSEITKKTDIKLINRCSITQEKLDAIFSVNPHEQVREMQKTPNADYISLNVSLSSLKDKNIPVGTYGPGKNFSFCDFENVDLRGCIFERCNFSFAINLDKTIKDKKTDFTQNNFTGVDENELPMSKEILKTKKNNVGKLLEDFTDKEIEEMFKRV